MWHIKPTLASVPSSSPVLLFIQLVDCSLPHPYSLRFSSGEKGRIEFAYGVSIERIIPSSHQRMYIEFHDKVMNEGPCLRGELAVEK